MSTTGLAPARPRGHHTLNVASLLFHHVDDGADERTRTSTSSVLSGVHHRFATPAQTQIESKNADARDRAATRSRWRKVSVESSKCMFLVAGVGFEPHDLKVMSLAS